MLSRTDQDKQLPAVLSNDAGIRYGQDRRRIDDDQVKLVPGVFQERLETVRCQQFRRVWRVLAAGDEKDVVIINELFARVFTRTSANLRY